MCLFRRFWGKRKLDNGGVKGNVRLEEIEAMYADSEKESISHIRGFDSETYDKTKAMIDYSSERARKNSDSIITNLQANLRNVYQKNYRKVLIRTVCDDIDRVEADMGMSSACTKGCYYCCKQAIYVNEYEEKDIINRLQMLPLEEKQRIKKRAKTVRDIAEKNNIFIHMTLNNISGEKDNNIQYLGLNLECPLLTENKECSIYEYRPMTCVTFRNYGKPEDCDGQIAPHCYSFQEEYHGASRMIIQKEKKYDDNEKFCQMILRGESLLADVLVNNL